MTIHTNPFASYRQNDPAFWWTNVRLGGRTLRSYLIWAVTIPLSGLIVFTLMATVSLVASKVFGYNEASGVTPHAVVSLMTDTGYEKFETTDMRAANNMELHAGDSVSYYYGHEERNFDNFRDGYYPEGGVITSANDGVLFWISFAPFMLAWVLMGLLFMFHPHIGRYIIERSTPRFPPHC